MENFFLDNFRASMDELQSARLFFGDQIKGRKCMVIGSAPRPIFPSMNDPYVICVNGSAAVPRGHYGDPNLTYLNTAIFRDNDIYALKTRSVLVDRHLGHLLVPSGYAHFAADMLLAQNTSFLSASNFSKYCKRIVLGEVFGRAWHGAYYHKANVSNGVFMAAFAIWAGATEVVLVGFSLSAGHSYSEAQISLRDHVAEDLIFLRKARSMGLPLVSTSAELHSETGVELASSG